MYFNPTNVSRIENNAQNLGSSSNKSSSVEELINIINKKNKGSLNQNENNNAIYLESNNAIFPNLPNFNTDFGNNNFIS